MANKIHNMISFDSDSWEYIREMLELPEDLECKFCNTKITKDTVGGISWPKEVFCRDTFCLTQHVMEQNNKEDALVSGDEQ